MKHHENLQSSIATDSSIETIRAIAVLLVFVHHLHSILGLNIHYFSQVGGWLGVQMFFIISGYLIIKSASKYSARTYAKYRIYRIYPAYIFWFFTFSLIFNQINADSLDIKSLLLHLTFLQHFFPAAYLKYNALSVSWTLSVEAVWYVIAFLVAIPFFKRPTLFAFLAIAVSCLWTFGGNVYFPSYGLLNDHQKNLFGNNNIIGQLPFFFFGAWIAAKEPKFDQAALLSIVISTLLLFPAWAPHSPHPIFITGFGVAAFFLMLKNTRYTNAKPVKFLSDVSYSFYLIHYPIIVIVANSISNKYQVALVSLVATLVLSYISYRLIEQPFINYSKRRLPSGKLDQPAAST